MVPWPGGDCCPLVSSKDDCCLLVSSDCAQCPVVPNCAWWGPLPGGDCSPLVPGVYPVHGIWYWCLMPAGGYLLVPLVGPPGAQCPLVLTAQCPPVPSRFCATDIL